LRAQLVEAGEVVIREGEHAHSMYFIAAGEVEVAIGKKKMKLEEGQFFGEVAVLKNERRSGTVTALSRTNLLALSAQDLHALMQRDARIAARIKDVVEKRTGKKVSTAKMKKAAEDAAADESNA
jgi:voltage-gated potassium channel